VKPTTSSSFSTTTVTASPRQAFVYSSVAFFFCCCRRWRGGFDWRRPLHRSISSVYTHTHPHTPTYIYIYVYIYKCTYLYIHAYMCREREIKRDIGLCLLDLGWTFDQHHQSAHYTLSPTSSSRFFSISTPGEGRFSTFSEATAHP